MFVELLATRLVLQEWKQNPSLTKKQIGLWMHWMEDREENDHALSQAEFGQMKDFLRRHAPTTYFGIFPEEKVGT